MGFHCHCSLWSDADLGRFAAANLDRHTDVPGYADLVDSLKADDGARNTFLRACLGKLGLQVSTEGSEIPTLSTIHLSALNHGDVSELLFSLEDVVTKQDGEDYVEGENDLFHLEKPDSRWSMKEVQKSLLGVYETRKEASGSRTGTPDPTADYTNIPKRIVSHEVAWPEAKETPYFNHNLYYWSLKEFRAREKEAESWGDVFMYGEVVTSTNTLLERYVTRFERR